MNGILYLALAVGFGYSMYNLWKVIDLHRRRTASQTWPATTGSEILSFALPLLLTLLLLFSVLTG